MELRNLMQETLTKTKILTKKSIAIAIAVVGVSGVLAVTLLNFTESAKDAKAREQMLEVMKTKGCVADGLLTGSGGDTDELIGSINRSECQYLHRSIESWTTPPDFDLVADNMEKIEKKDMIFGMFLAEAIGVNSKYDYPEEDRRFDFPEMCRGAVGIFGVRELAKPILEAKNIENICDISQSRLLIWACKVFSSDKFIFRIPAVQKNRSLRK